MCWVGLYRVLMPMGCLFFLPGLLWKLWRRPGWKKTFGERFGHFSRARRKELEAFRGCVWVHAVSVGESVIALALVRRFLAAHPDKKVVISTGTTTGQELVRKQLPEGTVAIFCPMDFSGMVRRTLRLLRPSLLVILETEIWPNLILGAKRSGARVALVNARMSDHSARGYRRFRFFFAGLLKQFDLIAAQSDADSERFLSVSPEAAVKSCGNLKFDQSVPEKLAAPDWTEFFGQGEHLILLGASTHPGEEELLAKNFLRLRERFPALRLVLVPRHAERGGEILEMLRRLGIGTLRKSSGERCGEQVDCLLADTTGEMLKWMAGADVVVMGKSLAGHDEGHNLIEPALLKKAIVTGKLLRNFRFLLKILTEAEAVATVPDDAALEGTLAGLLADEDRRKQLGEAAFAAISVHAGATRKTLEALEKLL